MELLEEDEVSPTEVEQTEGEAQDDNDPYADQLTIHSEGHVSIVDPRAKKYVNMLNDLPQEDTPAY